MSVTAQNTRNQLIQKAPSHVPCRRDMAPSFILCNFPADRKLLDKTVLDLAHILKLTRVVHAHAMDSADHFT